MTNQRAACGGVCSGRDPQWVPRQNRVRHGSQLGEQGVGWRLPRFKWLGRSGGVAVSDRVSLKSGQKGYLSYTRALGLDLTRGTSGVVV